MYDTPPEIPEDMKDQHDKLVKKGFLDPEESGDNDNKDVKEQPKIVEIKEGDSQPAEHGSDHGAEEQKGSTATDGAARRGFKGTSSKRTETWVV